MALAKNKVIEIQTGRAKKPKEQSLTVQIYDKLRTAILTCEIAPGSEVSELDLAEQFSVSKTPVREALGRLASDGYVQAFPRRGYQIAPLTISDMNEIFDVRIVVESGAIELACARISNEELDELQRLAEADYSSSADKTHQQLVSLNRQFHATIAKAAHNERLYQLALRYIDELERFFYLGARLRDVGTETANDHLEIVEALRKRDAAVAREMITRHTEKTRGGLLARLTTDRTFMRSAVF